MGNLMSFEQLDTEMDVTETGVGYAITFLGLSNLCGRLLCGIMDKFPSLIMRINQVGTLGCLIVLSLLPHCKNYKWLYASSCAYGLFSAPMIAHWPSTLVILVGSESDQLNSAIALALHCYGLMTLAGENHSWNYWPTLTNSTSL